MSCHHCNNSYNSCTCTTGCAVQLDFECIIYHKANNEISELDGLNLPNGSTLELVIETIDEKIKQLGILDWSLPCLRDERGYTINTMQQFVTAVDTDLCILYGKVTNLEDIFQITELTSDPASGDVSIGEFWYRSDLNELRFKGSSGGFYKIAGIVAV